MPRTCTVCSHEARGAIDEALVAGASNRSLASLYDVSEAAVRRHKANHLPARVVKAQEEEDVREALDVVKQLKAINAASLRILADARDQGKQTTALQAIDRIHKQIELQARLIGELDERPVMNLTLNPRWIEIRAVIVNALDPHPDAQASVVRALQEAENGIRE